MSYQRFIASYVLSPYKQNVVDHTRYFIQVCKDYRGLGDVFDC